MEPVHPGEVLSEDILPALSMSKTAVADALGISRQTLYGILNGKQPVTAEMAVRFGKLFGNGGRFWINLQRNHDLAVAERTVDVSGIQTVAALAGCVCQVVQNDLAWCTSNHAAFRSCSFFSSLR